MAGFMSKHPDTAMTSSQKLHEMFGPYWFEYKNAVKKQEFRPIGPVLSYEYYWYTIIGKKTGKAVDIPRLCIDLDPYTDTYISDVCPFRASGQGRQSRVYIVNAIWRQKQDLQPAHLPKLRDFESKLRKVIGKTPDYPNGWEAYQLAPSSDSWTPVYVLHFTATNGAKVAEMSRDNVVKGVAYDVTDDDYGIDITVKYDPNGTGTGKYQYDDGKSSPLTDDEMDYLVHKLDVLTYPKPKEDEADWKDLQKILASEDQVEDKKAKSNGARGQASASKLDEDEDSASVRHSRASRDDDRDGRGSGRETRAAAPSARSSARAKMRPSSRSSSGRSQVADDDIPF